MTPSMSSSCRRSNPLFAALRAAAVLVVATLLATPSCARPPRDGVRRAASGVPHLDHVVVVVMENKAYDQVRTQPYTASLIAGGSSFSNSHGVTHPSQPNYLAMWAGSTFGVTSNDCPAPGSPFTAPNLGQACEAAGLTWAAYSENLPSAGFSGCDADGGLYARKHAPWTSFGNLDHANERPFSDLALAESTSTLPALVFVVPNQCNDTHNAGCGVDHGDAWLQANLPAMQQAAGPNGLVILTWDEDDYSTDNHVLTVFTGPMVAPNYTCPQHVTHYTVLRTICEALGLPPFGAAAAESAIADVWTVTGAPPPMPVHLALGTPAPNPAGDDVTAPLTLPCHMRVFAAIYDTAGREVRRLVDGMRTGRFELRWDARRGNGRRAPPGLYILRVTADDFVLERKITLHG